jgi:DNA invertase Pin-like site-specific DNA recombinase
VKPQRSRGLDAALSVAVLRRWSLRWRENLGQKLIDVIVVYKVDRLTRSLADFAKLVELFDASDVSFVSVTQQFNTTTSMGRLTLNVLLSFAQFEREVTSECIRDKIAASKRKGLWVGGPPPLGYQLTDGKLTVVEDEAERVRMVFRRYLELSGINELVRTQGKEGLHEGKETFDTGKTRGGIPFGRGALSHLLCNPFLLARSSTRARSCQGSSRRLSTKPCSRQSSKNCQPIGSIRPWPGKRLIIS